MLLLAASLLATYCLTQLQLLPHERQSAGAGGQAGDGEVHATCHERRAAKYAPASCAQCSQPEQSLWGDILLSDADWF